MCNVLSHIIRHILLTLVLFSFNSTTDLRSCLASFALHSRVFCTLKNTSSCSSKLRQYLGRMLAKDGITVLGRCSDKHNLRRVGASTLGRSLGEHSLRMRCQARPQLGQAYPEDGQGWAYIFMSEGFALLLCLGSTSSKMHDSISYVTFVILDRLLSQVRTPFRIQGPVSNFTKALPVISVFYCCSTSHRFLNMAHRTTSCTVLL